MAQTSGTAAGHGALLTALRTFLIAQNWTVQRDTTTGTVREIYFRGPNLTVGTQTVNPHVNIRQFQITATDVYNWEVSGAIGFNTNETFGNQPGVSPRDFSVGAYPTFTLFQNNIDYWFVGNSRRFIVVAKIGTVFFTMYAGFILPYSTPTEYPFPMLVAANTYAGGFRFSLGDFRNGAAYDPREGSAYIRHTDGTWSTVANYSGTGSKSRNNQDCYIWPWRTNLTDTLINNADNSYTLLPAVLASRINGGNVYGEMEGVFHVSGFGNSSEDTVTINSVEHLIIQTANRTGFSDFAAIRLS